MHPRLFEEFMFCAFGESASTRERYTQDGYYAIYSVYDKYFRDFNPL